VIDPTEGKPILDYLTSNNLSLQFILNTHHHFDHVSGNHLLKQKTGAEVIAPDAMQIPERDRIVNDGDEFRFGNWQIKVLSTPGHTPDSVSYYLFSDDSPKKYVFTGDTLFRGECGRILGTSAIVLWNSLERLAALPEDTLVFPGHNYTIENYAFAQSIDSANDNYTSMLKDFREKSEKGEELVPSTIAEERKHNIFLQASSQHLRTILEMNGATDAQIFQKLRRMKDSF
jgi:hydroxyacylglutathione hydrolase